jgi:hypothetical protein
MKLPIVTEDKWLKGCIILLFIVICIICLFPARNSSDYRKVIKGLTEERDSLKSAVITQETEITALSTSIKASEMKLDTANFVNSILKQKIKKYEKTFVDVRNMSTDDGILFLTKYLSEEAPN